MCAAADEPDWPTVKVEHFDASRVPTPPPACDPADGFSEPVAAEVRMRDGAPCVFLNGRPFPLFWGGLEQPNPRPDKRMRIGDIPFSAVTVHNMYYEWHPSKEEWRFGCFDGLAAKYAAENPGAYFIWDLSVYPPADFAKRHPEEMTQDDEGDRKPVQRFSWSFASEKAMSEIREMVDRAVRYLEASPYANRIIGYRVNSGTTIEWLGWEARPGHVNDFSEPSRRAFAAFVARRYPGLADLHVPSLAERSALDSPNSILWNREKHLNASAYMDFASWIVAQDVLAACGQAKETLAALGRRKLVGTYYGYTFYLNVNGNDQRRAHFALRDLIAQNAGRVDLSHVAAELRAEKPRRNVRRHEAVRDAGGERYTARDRRRLPHPQPSAGGIPRLFPDAQRRADGVSAQAQHRRSPLPRFAAIPVRALHRHRS